ncbi:hypothetical protein Halru_2097 [Halovivax ruber XH-70]|uniref:DUF2240 family protein n=1 Tax=Halovivax ruber (strain DSM 18193 / JCM 13892 / XH-70) TaxID=797302 RepID=L0ID45_HALRX|nr:DUF2240 family protein [Halovivax ruber]AGB16689.1 hypothetical protein Halru_2097 [Halovivax ruber XH-70]
MSLRVAAAAPFVQRGTQSMRENEFVVSLSMDRDWFSPDQATRLVDVATEAGIIERDGETLVLTTDVAEVQVPEEFVPDEDVLTERSPFERILDAIVADGQPKHEAVGAINACQQSLGLTIEAAALVYARREGVDVADVRPDVREAVLDADA